jgi:alkylation response protein AidB-like acyl-CoA dehydrogenase
MIALDEARLNAAATSLGLGAAAIDHALLYARERVQFGQVIIDHQGLSFLFAELATELCAARALWQNAIAALSVERSRRSSVLTAMAKLACTDFGMHATVEAVQAMGANGLSKNYPVERLMRDAKALQIFDGTNQIQKIIIGRYLKGEGPPI